MEKIIKQKQIDYTSYIAKDGKEFEEKNECLEYESQLDFDAIDIRNFDNISYSKENHIYFYKYFVKNFIYNYQPFNDNIFNKEDSKTNILSYIFKYLNPSSTIISKKIILPEIGKYVDRNYYEKFLLNVYNDENIYKGEFYNKIISFLFKDGFLTDDIDIKIHIQSYGHNYSNNRPNYYNFDIGNVFLTLLQFFIKNNDEENFKLLLSKNYIDLEKINFNEQYKNTIDNFLNFNNKLNKDELNKLTYIFKYIPFKLVKTNLNVKTFDITTKLNNIDSKHSKYKIDVKSKNVFLDFVNYNYDYLKEIINDNDRKKLLKLLDKNKHKDIDDISVKYIQKENFISKINNDIKEKLKDFSQFSVVDNNITYKDRYESYIYFLDEHSDFKDFKKDIIYLYKSKKDYSNYLFEEKIINTDYVYNKEISNEIINFLTSNTPLDKNILSEIDTYILQIKELEAKINKLNKI